MTGIKSKKVYQLTGGDGGAYGPVFGPVLAEEVREITGEDSNYLMLRLLEPIKYGNDLINYLVVSPRYVGDTLGKLRNAGCTVGVGRVLPGKETSVQTEGVTNLSVEYWSIGSCLPHDKGMTG